jgi:hypothetical protein
LQRLPLVVEGVDIHADVVVGHQGGDVVAVHQMGADPARVGIERFESDQQPGIAVGHVAEGFNRRPAVVRRIPLVGHVDLEGVLPGRIVEHAVDLDLAGGFPDLESADFPGRVGRRGGRFLGRERRHYESGQRGEERALLFHFSCFLKGRGQRAAARLFLVGTVVRVLDVFFDIHHVLVAESHQRDD